MAATKPVLKFDVPFYNSESPDTGPNLNATSPGCQSRSKGERRDCTLQVCRLTQQEMSGESYFFACATELC